MFTFNRREQRGGFNPSSSGGGSGGGGGGMNIDRSAQKARTLWMGDLDDSMDDEFVKKLFANDIRPSIHSVKIIKDRNTGKSIGYGFVEFSSIEIAKAVLESYAGKPIPTLPNKIYRLNWASQNQGGGGSSFSNSNPNQQQQQQNQPNGGGHFSGGGNRSSMGGHHSSSGHGHHGGHHGGGGKDNIVSIFVGDLAPDVNDYMLEQTFRNRYPSVRGAKVVMDPKSGVSRGYGFVKFSDEDEMMRSMTEMQGVYVSSRPIKISHATNNFKSQGAMGTLAGTGLSQNLFNNSALPSIVPTNIIPSGHTIPTIMEDLMPSTATGAGGGGATTIITTDPLEQENTTVYVGNLSPNTDEKVLREFFQGYGPITSVKIPTNSNCGFINFTRTEHAERAIIEMNGIEIQGNRVRVSWGRVQHNKKQLNQMDEETLKQRQYQAAVTAFQYQQHQLKSIMEKKQREEDEKRRSELSTTFTKPFDIEMDNQRFLDENKLMEIDFF